SRDAFAPTSLLLSVILTDGRTSPRYTIATLIAGKSNTLHVDVRLDQGIKYVFTVNGPHLSLLGYYAQTLAGSQLTRHGLLPDIGQSTPLNGHNATSRTNLSSMNQNSNSGIKIAPPPTTPLGPSGANGFPWGAAATSVRAVPSSMSTGNDQPISEVNNLPHTTSQFVAADNGTLPNGSHPGANITSSRAIKPLRYHQANRPPSSVPFNPLPNPSDPSLVKPSPDDNSHAHVSKRVKNGDGTFTNRYTATDGEPNGGSGHYGVALGANGNKRKSTADNGTSAVERGSAADGGGGYSSRTVAPATYPPANMPKSSAERSRPAMPYTSPHVAPQVAYSDQNQAGPSQFRLPGSILPTQKSQSRRGLDIEVKTSTEDHSAWALAQAPDRRPVCLLKDNKIYCRGIMTSASKPHLNGEYLQRRQEDLNSPISGDIVVKSNGTTDPGRYFYSEYLLREHLAQNRALGRRQRIDSFESDRIPVAPPTFTSFTADPSSENIFIPPNVIPSLPASRPVIQKPPAEIRSKPATNIDYEWQVLEKLQSQLLELKNDPLKYWNPADVQFSNNITELPNNEGNFTSCLAKDTRNSTFLGYVDWLQESQRFLVSTQRLRMLSYGFSCKHKVVTIALEAELKNVRRQLEVEWDKRCERTADDQESVCVTDVPVGDLSPEKTVFFIVLVVVAILHIVCNLSFVPSNFLLGAMRLVFKLTGSYMPRQIDVHIPGDIRTVIDRLGLAPSYTTYVCCPKCFQLFDIDDYPEYCNNTSAPNSPLCNRRLRTSVLSSESPSSRSALPTKPDRRLPRTNPVRSYHCQDLKKWITWMHNRQDIAPYLERSLSPEPPADGKVKDIWESQYLRTFLGPDGHTLFLSPENCNESRLVFNLNVDGFNPYGNRLAGKKAINDLDQLWRNGFYMAKTVRHPRGRSVRAALALLVCDLPAARLLGGFAHYCSTLDACSMCKTVNINDLDPQTFLPRTNEEHRRGAFAWLAAQSEEERDMLYRHNGVRWSELLRLEYWDPVKNTVIDPMHGFYLRIFQRHCRQIWGMNVDLVDCDGLWEVDLPTEEGKVVARDVYYYGSAASLKALKVDSLRYLAIQEGIDYRRSKKALAESLLQMKRVIKQWRGLANNVPVPAEAPSLSHGPTVASASASAHALSDTGTSPDPDVVAAQQALLSGEPKAYFKKLSSDTILRLAKLYGVEAFTPAGAPSRAKHLLVDALFKWRNANKSAQQNLPNSAQNTQLLQEDIDRQSAAFASATASEIQANTQDVPSRVPSFLDPGHDLSNESSEAVYNDYLVRFFNASKSQIDHYPAKILDAMIDAIKIWMKTATHDDHKPSTNGDGIHEDDFFETHSDGSFDLEHDLDGYDLTDYRSAPDSGDEDVFKEFQGAPLNNKGKRNLIHDLRTKFRITNQDGQLVNKTSNKRSAVLGKNTLAAVREDMERLQIPSWMAAAPSRPGEASQGKFTADQWRTFCTVNLPVTLIRLWGSQPSEGRRHRMLVNFMHLVTSVRLADMRVTTEEQIQSFEHHYQQYITTLIGFKDKDHIRGLYPHTRITPYQHMMLHFGDLLRRFGPVHSWRCFPFERFNYILQTTKTNSRFGELEKTMFTRFCMMQKLKSLFHGGRFPSEALALRG
ncbi:hypothetical protein FB446DRAFT_834194, partial [Lentinula raphanica]